MTSLTQRSSGLVQRRTEASRSAADKERAPGQDDHDEPRRGDELEDNDTGDAKETRLTLMEEVLLLGLKDREVTVQLQQLEANVSFWRSLACCCTAKS